MSSKVVVDKIPDIIKATRQLAGKRVLVGVPETTTDRDDDDGTNVTNAAIAYWMEFGVPEKNIPARASIVPGVQSYKDRAIERLKKAGQEAIDGQMAKANAQLEAIGLEAVSAVRMKIRTGPFVPLAPSTIAARRRSDLSQLDELYKHSTVSSEMHSMLTGTQPLIDKGKFLQSINYVVRNK